MSHSGDDSTRGRMGLGRLLIGAGLLLCLSAALSEESAQGSWNGPAARVLGSEIWADDAETLRYLVLRRLTDSYAERNGIHVDEDEIDAHLAGMERVAERDRMERRARRDRIDEQLAASGLDEARRTELVRERDALDELLVDLDDMARARADDSVEERRARRTVAAAFVRQWKIDRALYEQYGGRIGYQQGGPEPLDAYRRFLEEQRSQGAFEILDEGLEAGFWRYYRDDDIHSFYPEGSAEEAAALADPWWLAP